jgi:hypothetical protein
MMYICTITAQLATKSYASPFEPMRISCSSPATAASRAIRAAKKALPGKKVSYWSAKIVPVFGTTK